MMTPLGATGLTSTTPGLDSIFLDTPFYSGGGEGAYQLAVGDVNGDSKLDLVVANVTGSPSGGGVGVLLGNGDGTFQPALTYALAGENPYAVALGDLNGDKKLDVVVANGDGSIGVLLGNGDGSFQTPVSYSAGGLSTDSVVIADVNNDGKLDVITASLYAGGSDYSDGSVAVLLGNGDGTLQQAVSYHSGGWYAFGVVVADVNGDSKPDLVVANWCVPTGTCPVGGVGILLGNGNGTFNAA
jgi:hypothetical protein